MKYCADTWYVLMLFRGDAKAIDLLKEAKIGKTEIIIPLVVYTESIRKLFQLGLPKQKILEFYEILATSRNISIVPLDRDIAMETASISHTFSLSIIDSFVAATTRLYSCDALLTADTDYKPLIKKKYLRTVSW